MNTARTAGAQRAAFEEHELTPGERERAAALLACALLLEGASLAVFFMTSVPWPALPAHLLAALVFGMGIGRLRGKGWARLGGILAFFLPGCGWFLVMGLLLLRRFSPAGCRRMLPALSEHLPAEPDAGAPALAALPADRLVEMLGTGDPAVKRAAIDEMARRRDRALLARLGECLSDPHPEIYRYARAKLSQIHEEFEGSLMDALAEIKCRPASPRAHALLVRLLTAHQDTGLVDESLEEYFTEQVAAEAQKIMLLAPGDLSPRVHLARICLKRGQPMEALLQFKALLEHDDRNLEARFGVVEALYDLAEHEEMAREIRTLLATAFTDGGADGRLMDAARWWLLPDEPSPALEEVPQ